MSLRAALLFALLCACAGRDEPISRDPAELPSREVCEATHSDPIVRTPEGVFRGSWLRTPGGNSYRAFRGIRYAEPPVGERRFQPPKPITSYEDEVDARKEGPACPMPAPPEYLADEDCLRLSVYTTTNSSNPMDVLVFLHPGFYTTAGCLDLFPGGHGQLMDHRVLLVTVHYRLGALGFLSTGDMQAPGNNFLKDQLTALRWVRRNIAAFGGNPDLVTLAGCGTGSISVKTHLVSPITKGLFHTAMSNRPQPGTPLIPLPSPAHQLKLAGAYAELLGCPTDNSTAIVRCLRDRTWQEITEKATEIPKRFRKFLYDPIGLWSPVVEPDAGQERYLTADPSVDIHEGRSLHGVPHMFP